MTEPLSLRVPSAAMLDGYVGALRQGWSPNNLRDVSGEQLAAIAADADGFIRELVSGTGAIRLADGRAVPRLPGPVRWLWDGAFCGSISLRYQPGTAALPEHVSGHIGYAVVPWKRRRGHATAALRMILPEAVAAGLPWVDLTCDAANTASRRVIETNGGRVVAQAEQDNGTTRLTYRIMLASPHGAL